MCKKKFGLGGLDLLHCWLNMETCSFNLLNRKDSKKHAVATRLGSGKSHTFSFCPTFPPAYPQQISTGITGEEEEEGKEESLLPHAQTEPGSLVEIIKGYVDGKHWYIVLTLRLTAEGVDSIAAFIDHASD